jgi:hypothetical protein
LGNSIPGEILEKDVSGEAESVIEHDRSQSGDDANDRAKYEPLL